MRAANCGWLWRKSAFPSKLKVHEHFVYTGSLNYYLIYALSYLQHVYFFFYSCNLWYHASRCDGLDWEKVLFLCALSRIAIILPSHPVRDNEVWGSGYKEQDKVFVECVFRQGIKDLRKMSEKRRHWTPVHTNKPVRGRKGLSRIA